LVGCYASGSANQVGDKVVEYIKWQPPNVGWVVQLNTDGASKEGTMAGCGGVIRGENGEWVCGFFPSE
jgi:hypothetical protein